MKNVIPYHLGWLKLDWLFVQNEVNPFRVVFSSIKFIDFSRQNMCRVQFSAGFGGAINSI